MSFFLVRQHLLRTNEKQDTKEMATHILNKKIKKDDPQTKENKKKQNHKEIHNRN